MKNTTDTVFYCNERSEMEVNMEQSFHYQLMAVQSLVQKKILEQLSDTNLTIGQPKVLEYLGHHDGMSQKDIARACHIEPGSMTSILNRMEDKNLIERKMLHGNRRSLYVFLTPYGKEMWNRHLHKLSRKFGKISLSLRRKNLWKLCNRFTIICQQNKK